MPALHLEVEDGRLAVGGGVVVAAVLVHERVEAVLVGVLLAPHEDHVLEEVREAGEGVGVGERAHAHAEARGALFQACEEKYYLITVRYARLIDN